MRKIKFDEAPTLKDPSAWDSSFIDFIKYCLVKDPKARPDADMVLKNNKKFLSKAKNKSYIAETLLKGVPTVQERVDFILIKERKSLERLL